MAVLSTKMRNCLVCREPLPEGTTFCVSCGNSDSFATEVRKGQVLAQAERRIGIARLWSIFYRWTTALGWFRWL